MKMRYFKLFLVLGAIIFGAIFFVLKSETPKKDLTESEAATTLIYYLQSLDDNYSDIAIYDNIDIIREWSSEDGAIIFQISSEELVNNDTYCIFGYYSRLNKEQGYKCFSLIDYYAVNRETGEIIGQQAWNENNVCLNDYNAAHGMSEEEAAKVFLDYIFPGDFSESEGNCYINSNGHVVYEWWDVYHGLYYFWCHGLAENKSYYIFEYWCDIYSTVLEDGVDTHKFIRSYYFGSYAVNKYNGEIVKERINDPETYLWEYNEEYFRIIDPSHEYHF